MLPDGIDLDEALAATRTGDLWLFRGHTIADRAIQLGSETGTMVSRNVLIENNYVTGGNCTINISGTINAENVQVRNNRFGTESRYNCPVLTSVSVPMGEANVMDVTGYPIQVQYAK